MDHIQVTGQNWLKLNDSYCLLLTDGALCLTSHNLGIVTLLIGPLKCCLI